MARQRDRVRVARVLRALLVAALGSLAATTLFEQDLGRDLVVPLWAVTWAPPAFYLLLALVALRHTPAGRRLGWAVATCGVNAGLGLITALALSFAHPMSFPGAFIRALWTFAPAPAIHLVVAPLVMFAWRSRVRPRMTIQLDRSATPQPSRPATPHLPAATQIWDGVHEAPSFDPRPAPFERVARQPELAAPEPVPVAAPAPAPVAAAPAPTSAPQPEPPRPMAVPYVAPPPPPADEPLVRISFDRIAVQLPPDVFVLPPARLAESLREPLVLTVPSCHVLPHLAEGAIDIPWAVIEYQFPEMAFALPQAEVRRRFAGWHLSLPMDEVLRQAPPDLWRVDVPAPDLTALTQFPAPFTPGKAAPSSPPAPAVASAAAAPRTPPPPPPPAVAPPPVEPIVAETPVVAETAVVSEAPIASSARVSVPPVPVAAPSAPVAASAPAPPPAAPPAAPVVAAPAPVAPPAAPVAAAPVAPAAPVVAPLPVAPATPIAAPPPVAPVAAPAPVAASPAAPPAPAAAPVAASRAAAAAVAPPSPAAPIAQPAASAPAKTVSPSPVTSRSPAPPPAPIASAPHDEESAALARALGLCLSPLGALEWQTRRVDGRILVSFVAPALAREAIDALASRATTLAGRLGRWPVDQLTIRTSRVVCILTPLGARGWLAASVRGGGPVALVELLSSRARSATANTGGADPSLGADDALSALSPAAGPLASANGSVAAATRVLTAFGSIVASTAAPEAGGPTVYAFAADSDGTLVGVARIVHTALVVGHDDDALGRIESVALRRGRERAIVRPLRGMGGPAVLAAAGQVALAGRAHRAAVKAAALLEAK